MKEATPTRSLVQFLNHLIERNRKSLESSLRGKAPSTLLSRSNPFPSTTPRTHKPGGIDILPNGKIAVAYHKSEIRPYDLKTKTREFQVFTSVLRPF